MDKSKKILILKLSILVNLGFLACICSGFFILNNGQTSYFRCGWSKDFTFVSVTIDTAVKYYSLIGLIITLNTFEVFLNDVAYPLITFSTYNPYKNDITDFTRFELELYSNCIYFIQASKRILSIATAVSQVDVALIGLASCQLSAYLAIKWLLEQKTFRTVTNEQNQQYVEVSTYQNDSPTRQIPIQSPLAFNL